MIIKKAHLLLTMIITMGGPAFAQETSLEPPEISIPDPLPTRFWDAGVYFWLSDGFWLANFMGHFRISTLDYRESRWIYHQHHGWIWVQTDDLKNLWMYLDAVGWCYTTSGIYPLLYSVQDGWLYYVRGSSNPRNFYVYEAAEWKSFDLGYQVDDFSFYASDPRLVYEEPPTWPQGIVAAAETDEGRYGVTLCFIVNEDGSVSKAAVQSLIGMSSSNSGDIDVAGIKAAVLEAIAKCRFSPGQWHGKVEKAIGYHKYFFKLAS